MAKSHRSAGLIVTAWLLSGGAGAAFAQGQTQGQAQTIGACSPAIGNVTGNVTLNINCPTMPAQPPQLSLAEIAVRALQGGLTAVSINVQNERDERVVVVMDSERERVRISPRGSTILRKANLGDSPTLHLKDPVTDDETGAIHLNVLTGDAIVVLAP